MLSDESGGRSALIILLLLPAPLTAIAIMLGLVLVIADSNTVNLDVGGGEAQVQAVPQPTRTLSAEVAALATISAAPVRPAVAVAAAAPAEAALALGYDESLVETGHVNYLGTCAGCHGTDALGIAGLGKTLLESEFVRERSDQELLEFVVAGRQPFDPENTTGILMPPRGGNPGLTDDDLLTIIAYMRTLDGFVPDGSGETVAAAETPVEAEDGAEDAAEASSEPLEFVRPDVSALLASLGVELEAPPPASDRDGEVIFDTLCGTRYEDLITVPPDFCDILLEIAPELDEDELFRLLQAGSPIWDADNETGVHWPARGGYPAMNDGEIANFIDYLAEVSAE